MRIVLEKKRSPLLSQDDHGGKRRVAAFLALSLSLATFVGLLTSLFSFTVPA